MCMVFQVERARQGKSTEVDALSGRNSNGTASTASQCACNREVLGRSDVLHVSSNVMRFAKRSRGTTLTLPGHRGDLAGEPRDDGDVGQPPQDAWGELDLGGPAHAKTV